MRSSTSPGSEPFPVRHVAEVEPVPPDRLWLIDQLWLALGVGVLGGAPKTCKTWIAAELAVAVASGRPAFGCYSVRQPGPVLFFGAEDSLSALRSRFEALAAPRGVALDALPLYLLDVAQLRLDEPDQLERLAATVERQAPRLLVLDPFVRLARVDENSAAEVSAVLGSLRTLQRDHEVAVLLVHHARKASGASPTQAFRGSGDFGAWGDSNLHVTRRGEELSLQLEHRSAAPPEPLRLRLITAPAPRLVLADERSERGSAPAEGELQRALLDRLSASPRAHSTTELREVVRRRKADVLTALSVLEAAGCVERSAQGWRRREPSSPPLGVQGADRQRSLFPA
ncbi:MAG: AAA family ATPase [Acidimicrobiia bacterium]